MADHIFYLKDRQEIAAETMAFWFSIGDEGFAFSPGQHVDITLINPPSTDAEGNTRTLSIASSPSETDSIMVATRMRGTAFKNVLKILPLGTEVKVSDPRGGFGLHEDAFKPAVFLIGGIGVTPVRSIIAAANEAHLPHQIYLFYSNKTPAATAFLEDFEKWAKQDSNFKFIPTVTDSKDDSWPYNFGRIDDRLISQHVSDPLSAIFYMSGPEAMVGAMRKLARGMGVGGDNIKTEEFSGY